MKSIESVKLADVREVYDGRRPSPQSSVHSQQPTGEFVRRQRAETEN